MTFIYYVVSTVVLLFFIYNLIRAHCILNNKVIFSNSFYNKYVSNSNKPRHKFKADRYAFGELYYWLDLNYNCEICGKSVHQLWRDRGEMSLNTFLMHIDNKKSYRWNQENLIAEYCEPCLTEDEVMIKSILE
jgi:hypothetical protein